MAVQEATEAPQMGLLMKCFPSNSRLLFLTMQPQPSPVPGMLPKLFWISEWISEPFIVVNRGQGLEDAAGVALHQRPPAHLARQQQVLPAQGVQVLHLQAQQSHCHVSLCPATSLCSYTNTCLSKKASTTGRLQPTLPFVRCKPKTSLPSVKHRGKARIRICRSPGGSSLRHWCLS